MAKTHLRPKPCLTSLELFGSRTVPAAEAKPDIAVLHKALGEERPVDPEVFQSILKWGADKLEKEPNVLTIDGKVTVIGPVRGQFFDLLHILTVVCAKGKPVPFEPTPEVPFRNRYTTPVTVEPGSKLLFLGDMIDGGHHSSQVLLLLLSLKLVYPDQVFLLRGRRESKFDWDEKGHSILLSDELRVRYRHVEGADPEQMYEACQAMFKQLPIGAVVAGKYWCVSGGLGPGFSHRLLDLNNISRQQDSIKTSSLCDAIWSDPMDDEDEDSQASVLFLHNYEKGLAYTYSFNATMHFLQRNNLTALIRGVSFPDSREIAPLVSRQSHNSSGRPFHYQYSCYDPGYRVYRKNPLTNFPVCVSLFSASRFLGENENKGAVVVIESDKIAIKQFTTPSRPVSLLRMANGVEWSLPILASQATACAEAIWNAVSANEDDPLHRTNELIRSNKEYDTKRARLLGFQRLCKLMKKRERAQGNSMVLNGLSGMVLNEAPPMQSSSNTKIPVWYTIDSFPRLQPLQNNWKAIREEAAKAWKRHVTLDLHRPAGAWLGQNADEFISHYMEQEGWIPSYQTKSGRNYKWKNYGLMHNGVAFKANSKACPVTAGLLDAINQIGKVRVAGFSCMEARSDIQPHRDQAGIVDNSLAFHLGLIVPSTTDCYLTVNQEVRKHAEGEVIIFDSTYTHSANNDADGDRIVLYVDFHLTPADPIHKFL
ncbi:Serine/threonine-protein phosphatase 2B catalytic subunit A1 [Diplonema papillatum]|nr:Serine/threonine-protein phosphatase 2B catalytic subunit A1 [Diplonema papillatum]